MKAQQLVEAQELKAKIAKESKARLVGVEHTERVLNALIAESQTKRLKPEGSGKDEIRQWYVSHLFGAGEVQENEYGEESFYGSNGPIRKRSKRSSMTSDLVALAICSLE